MICYSDGTWSIPDSLRSDLRRGDYRAYPRFISLTHCIVSYDMNCLSVSCQTPAEVVGRVTVLVLLPSLLRRKRAIIMSDHPARGICLDVYAIFCYCFLCPGCLDSESFKLQAGRAHITVPSLSKLVKALD